MYSDILHDRNSNYCYFFKTQQTSFYAMSYGNMLLCNAYRQLNYKIFRPLRTEIWQLGDARGTCSRHALRGKRSTIFCYIIYHFSVSCNSIFVLNSNYGTESQTLKQEAYAIHIYFSSATISFQLSFTSITKLFVSQR